MSRHNVRGTASGGLIDRLRGNAGNLEPFASIMNDTADALESQAREIERLEREARNDAIAYKAVIERQNELRTELAALKAQPGGVVLPERSELNNGDNDIEDAWKRGRNHGLKEVARLNQPASGGDPFKCEHAACVSLGEHHPFCEYVKQSSGGDGMCNADNPGERCICREEFGYRVCAKTTSGGDERAGLRYTNDGELAECPCCGSLDVGGAHDTVNCYGCGWHTFRQVAADYPEIEWRKPGEHTKCKS